MPYPPVPSHFRSGRSNPRSRGLPWTAAATAALLGVHPGVMAQAPAPAGVRAYLVAPGPLDEVLNGFARQAGISLSFTPQQVAGRSSPGLAGEFSVDAALARLLEGSGHSAVAQAPGRYRLQAAAAGSAAVAAAPPAGDAEVATLPTVVVTAAADTGIADASNTIVISRESLDRFPPTSPGDIFRDIAGVMVANNRNGPSLDLNIRGMQGFGRVKVLVDGTESSSSSYKGYGGESTRAFIDPELLGEVKIEKGPNAGPYGAGVVGGVVSASTLTAADLIKDGKSYGLRLRGTLANNQAGTDSYQVFGPGPSGSASAQPGTDAGFREITLPGRTWTGSIVGAWRPNDMLDLVAGLSRRRAGNYVSGSRGDVTGRFAPAEAPRRLSYYQPGSEVYNTSQDTDSVLLKAGLKLPADQRLDLGFSRLESLFGEARSAGYPEYIEQLNLSSADKKLYTARYAWSPVGNPWIDLRANVWAADSEEYQAADIRGIAMISGIHRAQHANTRGRGVEVWNTSVLDLWGVGLSLKYGATWLYEKARIAPLDGGIYMEPNGQRRMSSEFVQAEVMPIDSVTLNAGVRRERYEMRGAGEVSSGIPGQVLPLNIRHGESRTNPSLGATWQIMRAVQLFGRYGEGWRPPSTKETINGLIADSNVGRALLRPEFIRSTEAGARLTLRDQWLRNDQLAASLTFFRNKTTDYVQGFAGEFRNADSADFRGLEFNLNYDGGVVFARYAFTRYSKIEFCGVALAFNTAPPCFKMPYEDYASGWDLSMSGLYVPPKAQHSLTVGARLLERRLTLGARAILARDNAAGGDVVSSGWRSYTVYDLFAGYRINDRLNVNLSVENLTDRFYMDAGTSSMLAIPSPGRTAKLTLTYSL
ncbi:Heme/hemopexin utilization protein C precursor [Pigmentiphaga humi]|uniref:Heme/hemopexin utilization protein C n=1 Tax=Pigmentiphaga humi TaxID=2478468 RepID=A0A3P4B085_9BURK|nr:TonB-dependent receptor [Pigmentiphaga humi]VCU69140.1 Heme/hemopexin utilization protein C precursor [Pigmentiphaga humi]